MEDYLIVKMLFERSELAINSLSQKYGSLCKSISYNILKNEQDSEECVNDAYLAVWNTIPPQKPNSLSAYICKITRNLSLKKYRSNTAYKRNSYYDISLNEISECFSRWNDIGEFIEAKELTTYINQFLSEINQIDRIIFMQRYWFNRDISEIAKNMNKTKNYINVHLYRTRERLKKYLKEEGLF